MQKLVGESNFSLTDNRLVQKEFNAQILNKKLVYIDELKIKNANEENRLKLLINDTVEVEKKGVDSMNVDNWASLYVSSNDFDSIKLRGDDRRFSIVQLTDKKLIEVMSGDDIQSLFEDENVERLAFYLMNREVDADRMKRVFVSARTMDVREAALKQWEEWIIESYYPTVRGENVVVHDVTTMVEERYGSRVRPTRRAFQSLSERFPEILKVKRGTVKVGDEVSRPWMLEFSKSAKKEVV